MLFEAATGYGLAPHEIFEKSQNQERVGALALVSLVGFFLRKKKKKFPPKNNLVSIRRLTNV